MLFFFFFLSVSNVDRKHILFHSFLSLKIFPSLFKKLILQDSDLKQEQLLMDFLKSYNCDLSENQLSLLFQYAECVIKGNTITNLISKNDAGKFCSRHLTDSLIPVSIMTCL